jgi:uncharacterized DUF497 family protein
LRKHDVDFSDALIALEDENALTIEDTDDELRFKTPGICPALDILFVVHCEQSANCTGLISARKAEIKD